MGKVSEDESVNAMLRNLIKQHEDDARIADRYKRPWVAAAHRMMAEAGRAALQEDK